MDLDDDRKPAKPEISVNDNLDDLSVEELEKRILAFKAEITRIEAEIVNKRASKSDADSVFKI